MKDSRHCASKNHEATAGWGSISEQSLLVAREVRRETGTGGGSFLGMGPLFADKTPRQKNFAQIFHKSANKKRQSLPKI